VVGQQGGDVGVSLGGGGIDRFESMDGVLHHGTVRLAATQWATAPVSRAIEAKHLRCLEMESLEMVIHGRRGA
jgi:hypothetical protein